jgi:soluble lytic murein transglycosylase
MMTSVKRPALLVLLTAIGWLALTLACSLPARLPFQATETPTASPTATNTPTPTPTPTPDSAAILAQAEQARFAGDWDRAFELYQQARALAGDPGLQAATLYGEARTYLAADRWSEALAVLEQLLADYPTDETAARAHFLRGQTLADLGRPSEAAEAYKAYRESGDAVLIEDALELEADARLQAGDGAQAAALYLQIVLARPPGEALDVQVKLGNAYSQQDSTEAAIEQYLQVYNASSNDFVKAQMDLVLGRSYLALGDAQSAYARYLDAVENFPLSYDSYIALVDLVNAGVPVSDLDRGIVDYFAQQYDVALAALNRYAQTMPAEHDGAVHHYRALTLRALGQYQAAIDEWDVLLTTHPVEDPYFTDGWEQRVDTLWAYMDQYTRASSDSLAFADLYPDHPRAGEFIFYAAQIAERANQLVEAARLWDLLVSRYPQDELAFRAAFLAGVARFRLGEYNAAVDAFNSALDLAGEVEDQAAAYLWIGKTRTSLGDHSGAEQAWRAAQVVDPGGYYGLRAEEILRGGHPFQKAGVVTFPDEEERLADRQAAEQWMRQVFNLEAGVDLTGLMPELAADERLLQGEELWALGELGQAKEELDALRVAVQEDPVATFQLMLRFIDMGLYQPGIRCAFQILYLAGLDQVPASDAPAFLSSIRFGPYFGEIILPAAEAQQFDPLFILSVARQESLFESFATSYAAARGLMQIVPSTGETIAATEGWPPGFTPDDLYRPIVSVRLGVRYLADQRYLFNGDLYATLAAYNAGPGNVLAWDALAAGDPDLFLEVIRLDQPRDYIRSIYWAYRQYQDLYAAP